eukprot:24762-Eustigmatos_ZCMA.PRE.1
MMRSVNPSCKVCGKSADIRLCYDILQQRKDVAKITVEFPLRKSSRAATSDDDDDDDDDDEACDEGG